MHRDNIHTNRLRMPLDQLMKLTQKKCNIRLPSTKSANALFLSQHQHYIPIHNVVFFFLGGGGKEDDSPLMAHTPKLLPVLGVGLYPQPSGQDELAHRGRKPGQKRIERLYTSPHTH